MTPEERRELGRRVVRETTAAQGVPYHMEDATVLAKVVRLIAAGLDRMGERPTKSRAPRPPQHSPSHLARMRPAGPGDRRAAGRQAGAALESDQEGEATGTEGR